MDGSSNLVELGRSAIAAHGHLVTVVGLLSLAGGHSTDSSPP